MNKQELQERTKKFALDVINLVSNLPQTRVTNVIGHQLLKCGTSIGANYREANRAVSRKDFLNKIGIVEKEAAETEYWLELLEATKIGNSGQVQSLLMESREILAIFTSIGKTTKTTN